MGRLFTTGNNFLLYGKLDSGGLIKSTPVRNAAQLFAFVSQRGLEWGEHALEQGNLVGDSAGERSHGLCGLRDLSAAGPDGLATAAEAEAPALMFNRWSHAGVSATVTDGGVSSGDDATGAGDYVFDHNGSGNWIFSP